MLGLVDYSDASSDEEEEEIQEEKVTGEIKVSSPPKKLKLPPAKVTVSNSIENNGNISDEEDLHGNDTTEALIHLKLPPPKKQTLEQKLTAGIIEEEDDEFLKKKALPSEPPPKPKPIKGPVKITIPSLKDFKDEDMDIKKVGVAQSGPSKGSGLLKMLPKPKTETSFVVNPKNSVPGTSSATVNKKVTSLIPDSVKKHQEALKKGINPTPSSSKKNQTQKNVNAPIVKEDSDDDDDMNSNDFFSLDKEEKLPDISSNEITLMVAKKAAKMAETKTKIENSMFGIQDQVMEEEIPVPESTDQYPSIDQSAVQQLIGGNKAKRAKMSEDLNFIEISDADLKPNREEFLRQQLARSTQFVPTGKLEGYDKTGKRNSQITKLAQRALANEQELEAMWAANRQNKRAASSKYGF